MPRKSEFKNEGINNYKRVFIIINTDRKIIHWDSINKFGVTLLSGWS